VLFTNIKRRHIFEGFISYHAMSCYVMLCYVMLYVISYHICYDFVLRFLLDSPHF